jgi:hypothetical protein
MSWLNPSGQAGLVDLDHGVQTFRSHRWGVVLDVAVPSMLVALGSGRLDRGGRGCGATTGTLPFRPDLRRVSEPEPAKRSFPAAAAASADKDPAFLGPGCSFGSRR